MEQNKSYRQFTGPAELNKALNELSGIVQGINTDETVGEAEINELVIWCKRHSHLKDNSPFNELLPIIDNALADNVLEFGEQADILWLCSRSYFGKDYYDDITGCLQILNGFIYGVLADETLSDKEIYALSEWINKNDFLKGCYPFDEIDSLLTSVLRDKVISADERNELIAFLASFVDFHGSTNWDQAIFSDLREKYCVSGICAVAPDVSIEGKIFCFTGELSNCSRSDAESLISSRNGIIRQSVSSKTDYLVVGNAGNPCWAYACYGRKIEKAMQLRKEGCRVQIINEVDLWDALEG